MAENCEGNPKVPLIGLLAVKNHLITKEELQEGLSQCGKDSPPDAALKAYLLSNELISSKNMARLEKAAKTLDIRQKEFKFGALAVRKGFINKSVLTLALEEQEADIKNARKVRMLGDMLIEAGMLTPKQCEYILKLQKRARLEPGKPALEKPAAKAPPVLEADEGSVRESELETGIPEAPAQKGETQPNKIPDAHKTTGAGSAGPKIISLLEPEVIDGGIKLEIAQDFMTAFITKTDHFDSTISTVQVKESLIDKGIVMGIVDDKKIDGFINSSGFKTQSFLVAKGISPVQGKDAELEFFFNTDYLKAGDLTEDGTIDFKDRGKVPHVEEGTVLAEKIPMVESRKGHSIYGDEIETIPGTDIALKLGKGAKISADGCKVLAAVKGFPKYALSGHIFVHQEYVTEGDVDFETGHIKYDGNVIINGRIKSGFNVKGNDVSAVELDNGEIDAEGNVQIAGGINEGVIYSRGNIYAKFIHKSQITCMGDVIVEKEIVDSDVECSGACRVETGKLISSRIAAKMGVHAKDIGTEMASPNQIRVAHDAFLEKELEKNKTQVDGFKEKIGICQKQQEKFEQENLDLQKQITDLAHVQDRSQLEEKEISSKITSIQEAGGSPLEIDELNSRMDQLKVQAKAAEQNLDACFEKTEEIENRVEGQTRKIAVLNTQIDDLLEEKKNLLAMAAENPGKAEVIVAGAVLPETIIRGMHCEKRISELTRHVRFFESLCKSEDGKNLNIYEIQAGNI